MSLPFLHFITTQLSALVLVAEVCLWRQWTRFVGQSVGVDDKADGAGCLLVDPVQ